MAAEFFAKAAAIPFSSTLRPEKSPPFRATAKSRTFSPVRFAATWRSQILDA
jgi:hypothetical protein